jgi:hypothetical protein
MSPPSIHRTIDRVIKALNVLYFIDELRKRCFPCEGGLTSAAEVRRRVASDRVRRPSSRGFGIEIDAAVVEEARQAFPVFERVTLDARGREDGKISNLRESTVSVKRRRKMAKQAFLEGSLCRAA